jgi:hypothetical protein
MDLSHPKAILVEKKMRPRAQHSARAPQGLTLLHLEKGVLFLTFANKATLIVSQLGKPKDLLEPRWFEKPRYNRPEDRWASNQTLGRHVVHLLLI